MDETSCQFNVIASKTFDFKVSGGARLRFRFWVFP